MALLMPNAIDVSFPPIADTDFRCEKGRMADVKQIPGGVVHGLPRDFEEALKSHSEALTTWEDITPLARNEFICWIESAKKLETRQKRIDWGCESLSEGKRRPCCWPGCPHREKGS